MDQDDRFTVFLAKHRFIQTQPLSYLKVYHFDVYTTPEEKRYRLREVFHGQDTTRLLGAHPNLLQAGDMFAWSDDSFVEPTEYIEKGRSTKTFRSQYFRVNLGNSSVRMIYGGKRYGAANIGQPIGYELRPGKKPKRLKESVRTGLCAT